MGGINFLLMGGTEPIFIQISTTELKRTNWLARPFTRLIYMTNCLQTVLSFLPNFESVVC